MPCPSHPSWYHHPINIRRRVHIMELLIIQSRQPPVPSPLVSPNIFLSTMSSSALNVCSTFSFSHPCKTRGKIILSPLINYRTWNHKK
jgi:hypothetical protein